MTRFQIYPEHDSRGVATGSWRWRLLSKNGRITANSGESFRDETDARRAIRQLLRSLGAATAAIDVADR